MIVRLHPEAALEHEEQVAYYEQRMPGLGRRYDNAFHSVAARIAEAPHRPKLFVPPNIRRVFLRGFPFSVVFRESRGAVEVLAVAPHRKRPDYWLSRL